MLLKRVSLLFFVFGSLFFHVKASEERIKFFDCSMMLYEDNSMVVTEKITVVAAGRMIRRGIMREFPTHYKTESGLNFSMGFNLEKVTMNDKPVPHKVEPCRFGQRIYIGDEHVFLRPGVYTFEIRYRVTWVCAFFKEYDELYWNVTGNEWSLDIAQVRARVQFPAALSRQHIKYMGYTGARGSRENAYKAFKQADGSIEFETTKSLKRGEGLTIVVGWPKGYITEPSKLQNYSHFVYDNKEILILLLLVLLLLLYLSFLYVKYCRSHAQSTIIPRFEPPVGFSPGSCYYLKNFGFGPIALTAEMVEMARAGYLKIENQKDGWLSYSYYLHDACKGNNGSDVSIVADKPFYEELYICLFKKNKTLKLSAENNKILQKVVTKIKNYYSKKYDHKFLVFLSFKLYVGLIFLGLGIMIPAAILFVKKDNIYYLLLFLLVFLVLGFYPHIFKAYTPEGKRIIAEIEGFKMFLETTEKERLKIIGTPPTKTPELYETYLPYAIALGVEDAWTQQFAPVFEQMKAQGIDYVPMWYVGHGRRFTPQSFSHSFASSVRPVVSSSSGFGSRGSSGGGRGGGGGGGW